jgi:acyl dehydratase
MTTDLTPQSLSEHIGETLGVSDWITLDQARIDAFAECTLDRQWIHVDVERAARESPFGTTIAHGFLVLSLLAPTAYEVLLGRVSVKQAINAGVERTRFMAPVRAGKRVRNHIKVLALDDKGGGRYLLTTQNSMEIEGEDRPALVADSVVMLMV